jgi:uncharacterized membrane protein
MELRRILRSKVLLFIFILVLVWILALFTAPLTIPPGTVTQLDGFANRIDYPHLWDDLPLYPRIVYYLGDAQCHQKWYRTFFINGNQMPVDARDTAIYVGLGIGIFVSMLIAYSTSPSLTFIGPFPKKIKDLFKSRMRRRLFMLLIIVLLFLPLILDGSIQLFTSYESTNFMRVLTGLPLGFGGGYLIGVFLGTLSELRREHLKLIEKGTDL